MKTIAGPLPIVRRPLLPAFRLSFYLPLVLASLGLAWAEYLFLPWLIFLWPLMAAVIVLAYRQEGEWVLGARAANQLGFSIAVGITVWLVLQYWFGADYPLGPEVTWPASMLPHLGPMLAVLLLVKLFRPKTVADVWVTQTIGLLMIILACVLTGDASFGLLLVAYLAAVGWCLTLFFLSRQQVCDNEVSLLAPARAAVLPWTGFGLWPTLRWTGTALLAAFALFLLLPRQTNMQWNPLMLATTPTTHFYTGGDGGIDLNRVGTIELSDEVAFSVTALDAAGPKDDLPPDQRWRGPTLDFHDHGRWFPWQSHHDPRDAKFSGPAAMPITFIKSNPLLPELGEEEFFIDFQLVPKKAGTLVLAEPIHLGPEPGIHPYRSLVDKPQRSSFFFEVNGNSTLVPVLQPRRPEYHYRQVVRLPEEADLRPAVRICPEYIQYLLQQTIPEPIGDHSRALLPRLADLPKVPGLLNPQGLVAAEHWHKAAAALCRHLALSGEYTYSLELIRQDLEADPTVDFLLNVRSGHCERFAGSLTLMLRSLGIPARVVKGYLGAEWHGDGHYLIRQSQAHSWVEAVVPDVRHPGQFQWLTLDPTPNLGHVIPTSSWSQWFWDHWHDGRWLWRNLVTDYGGEQQAGMMKGMWQKVNNATVLGRLSQLLRLIGYVTGGVIVLLTVVLLRRRQRRRARHAGVSAAVAVPFYDRLLTVLARRCQLQPQPAQTPREFALAAAAWLATHPRAASLADFPLQAADCLYRVRYGGEVLSSQDEHQVHQRLDELETALR